MVRIGLCDDEKIILESLRDKISQYTKENKWEISILEFHSGQELIASEEQLDLLFLDIEMPGIDGIEAGRIFRRKNSECKIAMVTSMEGRMREAFEVEAFRFITKPYSEQDIYKVLEAFGEGRLGYRSITLYENRQMVSVLQKDIILIQTYDSYTEFLVGNHLLRSEKSLKALEEELDERLFVRIGKKYIVNLSYVECYHQGEVELADKKMKVARSRKRTFEEKFREYDLRYH